MPGLESIQSSSATLIELTDQFTELEEKWEVLRKELDEALNNFSRKNITEDVFEKLKFNKKREMEKIEGVREDVRKKILKAVFDIKNACRDYLVEKGVE